MRFDGIEALHAGSPVSLMLREWHPKRATIACHAQF
jgi:hypothetical protein